MRLLTVVLACLIFIAPSQAAENQIEQRLQIQQGRLKNIEEQASMKRRQIEDWHSNRLIEIRQLAERQAKQLRRQRQGRLRSGQSKSGAGSNS